MIGNYFDKPIYCYKLKQVLEVTPEHIKDQCWQCPFRYGSLQGEGVECSVDNEKRDYDNHSMTAKEIQKAVENTKDPLTLELDIQAKINALKVKLNIPLEKPLKLNDIINRALDEKLTQDVKKKLIKSSVQRGGMKAGHKYIKRTGSPGHYRYWYKDEVTGKYYSDINAPHGHEDHNKLYPSARNEPREEDLHPEIIQVSTTPSKEEQEKIMQEKMTEFDMTPSDRIAIGFWAGSGYNGIRKYQQGISTAKEFKEDADELDIAVNKIRDIPKQIFRGISLTEGDYNIFKEQAKKGEEITLDAHSSFSQNIDKALSFSKLGLKDHSVIFIVGNNKSGKDIKHFGYYDEEEALVPQGTRYVIDRIEDKGNLHHIFLKEQGEQKSFRSIPANQDEVKISNGLSHKFNTLGSEIKMEEVQEFLSLAKQETEYVSRLVDTIFSDITVFDGAKFTLRNKTPESLYNKMKGRYRDKTLDNVSDAIAGKFVFETQEDLDKAVKKFLLMGNISVVQEENHREKNKDTVDKGYFAHHVIIRTPNGMTAEIQFKTKNQEHWDKWTHDIIYKSEDNTLKNDMRVKTYAKFVADYLDTGDMSKPKPKAPSMLSDKGLDFDWSLVDKSYKKE